MSKLRNLVIAGVSIAAVAIPQGRPVDWPSFGGDARRSGWERSDIRITKDNVKDFQLVLKRKFDTVRSGPWALNPPVVIGLLISYKGFKELGFVSSLAGDVWSLDVDVDKMFWHKQIRGSGMKSGLSSSPNLCSGGMTATPTLTPPATFGSRRTARPAGSPSPGEPPTPAGRSTALPSRVGGTGFGAPRPIYILSSDGVLHQVATSDGSDQFPPLEFLPANARATSLAMHDYTIYTTTSGECGGVPNGVWAIDLTQEEPKTAKFTIRGSDVQGMGGLAVGNDGTVYVQTGPAFSGSAGDDTGSSLLALTPKELKLKGRFRASAAAGTPGKGPTEPNYATPVVFDYNGKDVIVSAGGDGRLNLLDSKSIETPLSTTAALPANLKASHTGVWGGLSTWEDAEGTRWVAAPVWGPLNPDLKPLITNGATPNGSVVAFRVEDKDGKPALTPIWVSRDLRSPQAPVSTSGVVFALSAGTYTRTGLEWNPDSAAKATLYALDGGTGKEMYSTGDKVSAPANLTGMSLANGRVYFTTTDSTLYAFGVYLER